MAREKKPYVVWREGTGHVRWRIVAYVQGFRVIAIDLAHVGRYASLESAKIPSCMQHGAPHGLFYIVSIIRSITHIIHFSLGINIYLDRTSTLKHIPSTPIHLIGRTEQMFYLC